MEWSLLLPRKAFPCPTPPCPMLRMKTRYQRLRFQQNVGNDLMAAGKKLPARKRGRPSSVEENPPKRNRTAAAVAIPTGTSRYDCVDHFPLYDENGKRQRCRLCSKGYSSIRCLKCNIYLCLVKDRNCFYDFHKQ